MSRRWIALTILGLTMTSGLTFAAHEEQDPAIPPPPPPGIEAPRPAAPANAFATLEEEYAFAPKAATAADLKGNLLTVCSESTDPESLDPNQSYFGSFHFYSPRIVKKEQTAQYPRSSIFLNGDVMSRNIKGDKINQEEMTELLGKRREYYLKSAIGQNLRLKKMELCISQRKIFPNSKPKLSF